MGLSNSEAFLSQKDPNDNKEFINLSVRPTLKNHPIPIPNYSDQNCQTLTPEDHQVAVQERDQEEEEEDCKNINYSFAGPCLTLKIPSKPETISCRGSDNNVVGDDGDDGLKTPTSSDHKIPVILQCPPAPRKSKPILKSKATKRKAYSSDGSCRRPLLILFDHDHDHQSSNLFPRRPLVVDLGGSGVAGKKVKL
ncbi:cyclin-dependent protein kinase inhibitor SMR3-like [Quillaja saponaria]|uniref:Cyclin-dependent protein kinase inhibitor SMR3-like n=1 Tax=Quillaja saponaria TaxID=32244 RepID=A0AAD7PA27_QUISA|nr:cyclin-dependent protein kinase inhibitor SMR3-like [Quillaja saponaria]